MFFLTQCKVYNLCTLSSKQSSLIFWKKKKKNERYVLLCRENGAKLLEYLIECCDGKSQPIKFFSADLIFKATNNFSECNCVYGIQSYLWNWYSGVNDNNRMILIKKSLPEKCKFNEYFCRDVAISSMVSGHKNFMKLAGRCLELEDPVMVYYGEKKQYSSIDFEKIVSWKRRMKIAVDIATALAYLHTAFSTPFVYRIMATENVLLDEDGVAKLINFSYCISIPLGETFVKVDDVVGTCAYIDDNYLKSIVSEKTDAYGFGIFMLMLLIGGKKFYELVDLYGDRNMKSTWVLKFIEDDRIVDEIVDPKMLENIGEITEEERCRMNAFLLLSVRCYGCRGEVPMMVEVTKEDP